MQTALRFLAAFVSIGIVLGLGGFLAWSFAPDYVTSRLASIPVVGVTGGALLISVGGAILCVTHNHSRKRYALIAVIVACDALVGLVLMNVEAPANKIFVMTRCIVVIAGASVVVLLLPGRKRRGRENREP